MRDEHVELLERPLVQQKLDPFARGQLALGMLRVDPALTATQARGFAPRLQLCENFAHIAVPCFVLPKLAGRARAQKRKGGKVCAIMSLCALCGNVRASTHSLNALDKVRTRA